MSRNRNTSELPIYGGNRLDAPYGDFFVLEPVVWKGRVAGTFGSPIIAFLMGEAGSQVIGYVTAAKTYPLGSPVWTRDGTVEMPDREWEDLESYEAHLKATLLQ